MQDDGTASIGSTGGIASLRDRAAIASIISGNSFAVLAQVAIMPAIAAMTVYFDGLAHDGVVISLVGLTAGAQLTAQLMMTLLGIGIMVGGPAAGMLAERIGYSALLKIALAGYALTGLADLYVASPVALLMSRFILGLWVAGISISCYSLTGVRFQGALRDRVLGYQSALVTIVGVISLLGAGQFADFGGWRAPFVMFLIAAPMCALAIFARWPKHERVAMSAERARLPTLKPLLPFYLALIPLNLAIFMTSAHIPFVLAGDGITKASEQSWILGSSFLFNLLTALSFGRISAGLGLRGTFALLIGLFALSNTVIGLSSSWVGTMIGCDIAGLGGGLMMPLYVSAILNHAPEAARSRALGLMYMTMYVGDFLNPVLVTPLRLRIGNHEIFSVIAAAMAIGIVFQVKSRRTLFLPQEICPTA